MGNADGHLQKSTETQRTPGKSTNMLGTHRDQRKSGSDIEIKDNLKRFRIFVL